MLEESILTRDSLKTFGSKLYNEPAKSLNCYVSWQIIFIVYMLNSKASQLNTSGVPDPINVSIFNSSFKIDLMIIN